MFVSLWPKLEKKEEVPPVPWTYLEKTWWLHQKFYKMRSLCPHSILPSERRKGQGCFKHVHLLFLSAPPKINMLEEMTCGRRRVWWYLDSLGKLFWDCYLCPLQVTESLPASSSTPRLPTISQEAAGSSQSPLGSHLSISEQCSLDRYICSALPPSGSGDDQGRRYNEAPL